MGLDLLLVLVASSVLIAAIGVPLWLQKVTPNPLYGFRTLDGAPGLRPRDMQTDGITQRERGWWA